MNTRLAVLALATAALAACEPNPSVTGPAAALQAARAADVSAAVSDPGAVYTLTNQVGGNAVAVFARGADPAGGAECRRQRRHRTGRGDRIIAARHHHGHPCQPHPNHRAHLSLPCPKVASVRGEGY